MSKTICATCKYNKKIDGEFMCMNEDSAYFGDFTEYDDTCYDWEDKSSDN